MVDLSGGWQVHPQARVSLAVNNLLDRSCWLWSDTRHAGVLANEPGVAFYSQLGRNISLSLLADF